MDARQSKRGKRISLRQEKQAAADLGGTTMAASGATRLGGGGDVRVMGNTRLECKFTEKGSYTLKYEELRKIRRQAMKVLEQPVFQFAFRHPSGRLRAYAVIPWQEDKVEGKIHYWSTMAGSVTFTEDQLEKALYEGRIQYAFLHPLSDPPSFRMFEIMGWHDYVEVMSLKHNEAHENARDQHRSRIPGAPDSTEGRDPESNPSEG